MGNLDFANHAEFSWCCILLMLGGLTMIVLGPLRGKSRFWAAVNVVLGIASFCYGLYLTFSFRGGHYFFSYWVLIIPAVLITRTIRSSNGEKVYRREQAKRNRYAELQDAQEAHAANIGRRAK
ncbi:MAG TPA: hypothetical protein VFN97_07670 [Actinospica sp.]|nr:hypothetical protein [Actinospica sp.]